MFTLSGEMHSSRAEEFLSLSLLKEYSVGAASFKPPGWDEWPGRQCTLAYGSFHVAGMLTESQWAILENMAEAQGEYES